MKRNFVILQSDRKNADILFLDLCFEKVQRNVSEKAVLLIHYPSRKHYCKLSRMVILSDLCNSFRFHVSYAIEVEPIDYQRLREIRNQHVYLLKIKGNVTMEPLAKCSYSIGFQMIFLRIIKMEGKGGNQPISEPIKHSQN